jgi:hypothetical protein
VTKTREEIMNKGMRIGLMAILTAGLLLAVTIPGMATEGDFCSPRVLAVNNQGDYIDHLRIEGQLVAAYWEGDTLFYVCSAQVPLGEPIDPGVIRYATFDEFCDYWSDYAECDKSTLLLVSDDETAAAGRLRDPETQKIYTSTYWEYELHRNGDLSFYKEYTTPDTP